MRQLGTSLAAAVALALVVSTPALAEDDQRFRLHAIWVSPSDGFADQGLTIDADDALGGRVAWERVWGGRYGLELAASTTVHSSSSSFEGAAVSVGDTRLVPATAAFNLHFAAGSRIDLYAGAGLAYVSYSDVEVAFPGAPNERFAIDDELTWLAQLGVDVPIGQTLGLSFGLQYLAAEAELQVLGGVAELSIEPWIGQAGLLVRF